MPQSSRTMVTRAASPSRRAGSDKGDERQEARQRAPSKQSRMEFGLMRAFLEKLSTLVPERHPGSAQNVYVSYASSKLIRRKGFTAKGVEPRIAPLDPAHGRNVAAATPRANDDWSYVFSPTRIVRRDHLSEP